MTSLVFADHDPARAEAAAARIRKLLPKAKVEAEKTRVNAADPAQVKALLEGARGFFAAVPYAFLVPATEAAIAARVAMVDLGGHTDTVWRQLGLADEAARQGAVVVPDCGLAPGMSNALAGSLIRGDASIHSAQIYCGGLPQKPRGPLGYRLFFNVAGLTNEYSGLAQVLRQGQRAEIPTLTEEEPVEITGVGSLRARLTSGGTSTAPWTFEGRVQRYEYKTLRYPGHWEGIALFSDLGFLSEEPIEVGGTHFAPRLMLNAVLERALAYPDTPEDVVILKIVTQGGAGRESIELVDRYDPATGFLAMERTTGFSAAAILLDALRGEWRPGVHRLEEVASADRHLAAMRAEGMQIRRERG